MTPPLKPSGKTIHLYISWVKVLISLPRRCLEMPATRFVAFVCLGDSLTVGYRSPSHYGGYAETPYTDMLEPMARVRLQELGLKGYEAFFINKGINGDSTDGMLGRFRTSVEAERPDYVIIWAGINDLYAGRKPGQVMENLVRLYARAIDAGAKPVACTLTPTEADDGINTRITELNALVAEHCDKKGIRMVDLFSSLAGPGGRLNPLYSDDGVHLSPQGYAAVARTVFDEVVSYILGELAGTS
jgi:lysophospholipase L1-like esterase